MPAASDGERPRRFGHNAKQELISRCQFCEQIIRHDWLPAVAMLDLGEDFTAHIYLDGKASGVIVFFQLKSKQDWSGNILKDGRTLTYRFDVEDLEHWETFAQPCVLVVWNVTLREGRWILVDEAIADLDRRSSKWRSNTTTTVHFPMEDTSDEAGFRILRQHIGHRMFDLIAKGRPLEFRVEVRLDGSERGRRTRAALEKFVTEGERVELVGPDIASFEGPEWWMPWFGDEADPDRQMLVAESKGSDKIISASISMSGSNNVTEILRYVELKVVRAGSEKILLSNQHQSYPLHIWLPIERAQRTFTGARIELTDTGRDVCESRSLLRFMSALYSGGTLALNYVTPDSGDSSLRFEIEETKDGVSEQELQLFDKLCTIQEKSGKLLRIPDHGVTQSDFDYIPHLLAAYGTGQVEVTGGTATISVTKQGLEVLADKIGEDNRLYFRAFEPEAKLEFLGQQLNLGPVQIHMHGTIDAEAQELRAMAETLDEGESADVSIVAADITYEYQDYI